MLMISTSNMSGLFGGMTPSPAPSSPYLMNRTSAPIGALKCNFLPFFGNCYRQTDRPAIQSTDGHEGS